MTHPVDAPAATLLVWAAPSTRLAELAPVVEAALGGAPAVLVARARDHAVLGARWSAARLVDDKPPRGIRAFVAELRRQRFERGVVVATGEWSYWPDKLVFLLARVDARWLVTERGPAALAWRRPWPALGLLVYRAKRAEHAVAGMPPGIPWPVALLLALLRHTAGRVVGWVWLLATGLLAAAARVASRGAAAGPRA